MKGLAPTKMIVYIL